MPRRAPDFDALPDDVQSEIKAFAEKHGVRWKSKLRDLWISGHDNGPLRWARNNIGPSALTGLTLPK